MRRKKPMLTRDWATECNLDRNRDLWRVEEGGCSSSGPPGGDANEADADWGAVFQGSSDREHTKIRLSHSRKEGKGEGAAGPSWAPKCNKKACLTVVPQPADSHRSGRYRGV